MSPVSIATVDPRRPEVLALVERHLTFARGCTPPEDVHALDASGLVGPGVTVFGAWATDAAEQGELLAIGALQELTSDHAELKSMHTAEAARRRGIGERMLAHLVAEARARGYTRLSLETGSGDAFAPARALYTRSGFTICGAFGHYPDKASSTFMALDLGAPARGS